MNITLKLKMVLLFQNGDTEENILSVTKTNLGE